MKKKYIVLYCIIAILVCILIFISTKYKYERTIDQYVPGEPSNFYEDKIFPSRFSKIEINYTESGNKIQYLYEFTI